jgi:hypothetical protein
MVPIDIMVVYPAPVGRHRNGQFFWRAVSPFTNPHGGQALGVNSDVRRQAKSVGLLNMRNEAINHVRHAMHDVILSANIRRETGR